MLHAAQPHARRIERRIDDGFDHVRKRTNPHRIETMRAERFQHRTLEHRTFEPREVDVLEDRVDALAGLRTARKREDVRR